MKRLLLALTGFFFVHLCHAEVISATSGPQSFVVRNDAPSGQTTSIQSSYQAACDAGLVLWQTKYPSSGFFLKSCQISNPTAGVDQNYGSARYGYGTSGGEYYGTIIVKSVGYSCPEGQNWTLSGTQCTRPDCVSGETRNPSTGVCESPCKAGQTRINGVCTCDTGAQVGNDGSCCPVAGSGGGAPMQWCYVDSKTATTCDSAGTNGCKVRCNNVTFQQGTGATVQVYPKLALGQSCSYTGTKAASDTGGGALNNDELKQVAEATKDPGKAKTPEGCMAAGMGYVQSASGTTCVPSGDTGVVKKESSSNTTNDNGQQTTESKTKETTSTPTGGETKETTTKTNPDGTTTTTTKTTTCKEDGTCTTSTTETTKDANGNTVGNKASSNQQSASEFCKANPDSDMCKGASDACKDHPDRLGCMGAGEAIEQPDLSTTEKGITAITPFNISSNAICPADLPLPKGMSFSFQPFCDYASAFRPIILALAWITAGFLAFGYRGNNG